MSTLLLHSYRATQRTLTKIKPEYVVEVIVVLFLILFIYASFAKLFKFEDFAWQIAKSPFLKPFASIKYVIAVAVPAIEITAALMLIFPHTRLKGFWLSLIIMILFTVYITGILTVAEYIPCSCGGVLQKMTWTQHLTFNIGFILLATLGIYLIKRKMKPREESRTPSIVG